MLYDTKEGKIKIENASFDYIQFGTGKKALIMIQGLNTNRIKGAGLSMAYMYRMFAKEYTVYLFDRRDIVYDGITVKDLALDVAATMDELGLKTADVFGVSQGGMIAQYLAAERPDLVNKLVLAVTLSRNNDTVEAVVKNWIRLTKQGDFKTLVLDMADKMYSEEYVKRYRLFMPLLTMVQKPKDVERFLILAKACLTCDTYDLLEKIQCPVFIIGGTKDKVVTGEASQEIAKKLDCEIYMYEKLGHAAYEEASDFNERVFAFLKKQ